MAVTAVTAHPAQVAAALLRLGVAVLTSASEIQSSNYIIKCDTFCNYTIVAIYEIKDPLAQLNNKP